ncbi:MAG: DUF1080 domain-containing protein [Acidobacteria bacterium]|nr:DUF1080 domain-containing protein [Acidobacteriota bacterium]
MTVLALILLTAQQPGYFSPHEFENAKVSFEYKLDQWAEAAVVLRTPKIGRPIQQGVAVFLAHDFHKREGTYTTGAIAGLKQPLKLLPPTYNIWHKIELQLEGNRIQVKQEGELIQDAMLSNSKHGKGHLHFASLVHKYEIRNLNIEELQPKEAYVEDWRPWQLRDAGTWQTGPNSATGSNGHPRLKNFLFSAEIQSTNNANGGIFFRGSPDKQKDRGFEVQIYSPLDSVFPTGSIYGLERSSIASNTESRWYYMQVLVEGQTCTVWVDGVQVATTTQLPPNLTEGQIGLQIHMENTKVEWRNLRAIKL